MAVAFSFSKNTPKECGGLINKNCSGSASECRCCFHSKARGWNTDFCADFCIIRLIPAPISSIINLVMSCLSVSVLGMSSEVFFDLNDVRLGRMLEAANVKTTETIEYAIMCALESVRKYAKEEDLFMYEVDIINLKEASNKFNKILGNIKCYNISS